ncbi:unnamed protein product [Paramecium octaurelia]|uniref:Uncharacterized protein n=1 Tax=Paramecium octaurelia TaxID=43137 RepID=A0A8S1VZS2_PAROT|nr:unnamed protein product [Paramecium octaurelia]
MESMIALINNQQRQGESFKIIDCCFIYDKEHLENQVKLKIKGIMAKDNDIFLKNIIQIIVDQSFILQKSRKFLEFTGRIFKTFSSEKELIYEEEKIKWSFCPRPQNEKWNIKNGKISLSQSFLRNGGLFSCIYHQKSTSLIYFANSENQLNINSLLSLFAATSISVLQNLVFHYN